MIGVEKIIVNSIVFLNLYTLRQWIERRQINVLLLHTSVCPHVNNWNMLSFYYLVSQKFIYVGVTSQHVLSTFIVTDNFVFNSLNDESAPYRKPEQTGKVIQTSHNTPTEPFQSWSTDKCNTGQHYDPLNTEH